VSGGGKGDDAQAKAEAIRAKARAQLERWKADDEQQAKERDRRRRVRHPAMVRLTADEWDPDQAVSEMVEQQRIHHEQIRSRRSELEQSSYDHLESFRLFLSKIAETSLNKGHLVEIDEKNLKRGLYSLNQSLEQFIFSLELLEGSAGAPGCASHVAMQMWGAIAGAFLIGERGTITESAEQHFTKLAMQHQGVIARDAKARQDGNRAKKQKAALRAVLGDGPITQPNKLAESIFRTPIELTKLKQAVSERGIPEFSESTAKRLLREMRDCSATIWMRTQRQTG